MDEKFYKIIELINKEIGSIPIDKEGFYSQTDTVFIAGLERAKEIILKTVKEDKK